MSDSDHDYSGLRFACTQCGKCCRFDSGYVFLSRADILKLSTGLGIESSELVSQYCRVVDLAGFKQISLREKANKDCIFWADGGCTVYTHRPLQCRSYPFWSHQLADAESWKRTAAECPGIGVGPRHSRETIEEWIRARTLAPPVNAETLHLEDR